MIENFGHIWHWLLLLAILLFLAYTMFVVREEKSAYKESALPMSLNNFSFEVPSWWGNITGKEQDQLIFKRTDTRYDWQASLIWSDHYNENKSIAEEMVELVKNELIEMDEENAIVSTSEKFQHHPLVKEGRIQIVRLEGTGTQDSTERIYFDAYLIRDLKEKNQLYGKSLSSVLNGGVEGPYFEEMMNHFTLS